MLLSPPMRLPCGRMRARRVGMRHILWLHHSTIVFGFLADGWNVFWSTLPSLIEMKARKAKCHRQDFFQAFVPLDHSTILKYPRHLFLFLLSNSPLTPCFCNTGS
ncbi:hypothetical protein BKA67DRAFT_365275 [Truncatella angustata]|uniref:Uncharacterized protein n=1 Tax=Truncatella angustata TaxID=152316 RepID=A0A9P8UEM5_9PEZI|nr:uncharacterized protein BKA67DRAFT_365275 [Truncatella angustata]KAH6648490.1 hypothetical protein BKA67DRAFT_365275 [Truncatella angustata]